MGGKNLKFPKRPKYVAQEKKQEVKEEKISEEEHQKRIALLKQMGLVKDTSNTNPNISE